VIRPKNVFWIAGLDSHSITDVILSGVCCEKQLNPVLMAAMTLDIQENANLFTHKVIKPS